MKRSIIQAAIAIVAVLIFAAAARAADFRIAIMQDSPGEARKYRPLADYLAAKGVPVSFVTANDYSAAAGMFALGQVDAMFSGSGVAGSMLIKGVAAPLVRPVDMEGISTYWAVVLAPKGANKFTGSSDYFKDKKVIFCGLASSGEFFFRSVGGAGTNAEAIKAPSHGAAIDALSKGQADVAIVKNWTWEETRARYPGLVQAGEDKGENPNNTLIVSKHTDQAVVKKTRDILLGLEADDSGSAQAVRDSLKIKAFIATTEADFAHTIRLLRSAGVDEKFDFSF